MKRNRYHSFRGTDRANDGSEGKRGGSAHSDDSRAFLLQAICSNSHAAGLFVVVRKSFRVGEVYLCWRASGSRAYCFRIVIAHLYRLATRR
jgi:hypothetical protein